MKKNILIIAAFMCMSILSHAQWALKLTSNVYLRTWKLDTKANKEEKEIGGATVTLFQNGKQISQTTSSGGGDFTIMVPKDGEYYLTVTYPGCNTKRMAINTQNVPEKISTDGYKPSFEITGGFIMVKPYPGINYSELSQDLIRVEYTPGKKAFDDTDAGTEKGLGIVSKIYTAEDDLFNRFCSTNKAGDVALAKPDCPLAKTLYEKAIAMIPGEKYPIDQLAKVGLCLKDKENAAKKAAEEAAAKAAAELAAKDAAAKKAAEDAAAKIAADNANKQQKDQANKDAADKKAIADAIAKANADKAALIKEEEAKMAKANKEKAAKEQAEADKIAKQKAAEEKKTTNNSAQTAVTTQTPTTKKGDIVIKQKSPEQIEKEAKEAKQREGLAKSKAEDEAAMKADADKAKAKYEEKQKEAREREQKQKEGLAKSKAEDEAAMKEEEAKKAAKQKEREEKQKEGMAKSKAEDDAALKADAEKKAKKIAEAEAEEKERKRLAAESKSNEGEMGKGDSDHNIPQVIGAAEKYRERIKAADELFKKKRYEEAKPVYLEALDYKPKDPYATAKLAEIEKLNVPK